MKRREKFKLVGHGFKCPLWIFQAQFARPDIARKTLRTLAGSKVHYNAADEVFFASVVDDMDQGELDVAEMKK